MITTTDFQKARICTDNRIDLCSFPKEDVSAFYNAKRDRSQYVIDLTGCSKQMVTDIVHVFYYLFFENPQTIEYKHNRYVSLFIKHAPLLRESQSPSLSDFIENHRDEITSTRHKSVCDVIDKVLLENSTSPNIVSLPKMCPHFFADAATTNGTRIIDLSGIESDTIKEEIRAYIKYKASAPLAAERSARYILSHYIQIWDKVLPHIAKERYKSLLEIPQTAAINDNPSFLRLYNDVNRFLEEYYDESGGFELDTWYLEKFNLNSERVNPTQPVHRLSFSKIPEPENKRLLKKYIFYLLTGTDLTITTIAGTHHYLCEILYLLQEKPIKNLERNDVLALYEKIETKNIRKQTYNVYVSSIFNFFEHLVANQIIEQNLCYPQDFKKTTGYDYKETSLSKETISQIFSHLNKMEKPLGLMFLCLYCTGMRVSEVCSIRRRCLQRTSEGCFIIYHSIKMKKDVTNAIPENLYKLIKEYSDTLSPETPWLFPSISSQNNPYKNNWFRYKMKNAFKELDVKDENGEPFDFKPHALRHTMGVRLRNMDIPFQYIQEQLHHESPEMTVAYIEHTEKRKIQKMDTFIDIHGEILPVINDPSIINNDVLFAEYLRTNINAQMLPNGVCAKPVKLGKCPHANSCLVCPDFRTSIEDLPIHRFQLAETEKFIAAAKDNGWTMQIESNEQVKENLMKIISQLEALSCDKE